MPRSVAAFETAGLHVIPAPTGFEGGEPLGNLFSLSAALPKAKAMSKSRNALHEIVGGLWYRIRY